MVVRIGFFVRRWSCIACCLLALSMMACGDAASPGDEVPGATTADISGNLGDGISAPDVGGGGGLDAGGGAVDVGGGGGSDKRSTAKMAPPFVASWEYRYRTGIYYPLNRSASERVRH